MSVKRDFGLRLDRRDPEERSRLIAYINLKLAGQGLPFYEREGTQFVELASNMLANYREKNRLLAGYLPPADRRIQDFLDSCLGDLGLQSLPRIPTDTFVLDRCGMARELSLPPAGHKHMSPSLTSYRVRNGVLHNPASDRRTTEGVFHVVLDGLPVPPDKKAVPRLAFARILAAAVNPPEELLELPYTSLQESRAKTFISILLKPCVRPSVPAFCEERYMDVRFFAPGSLAASLDFVESIFGNSGDPYVAENDSALDPMGWTGTTGCIILATHLTTLTKKELGLPPWEEADERERRDGMAWKDPQELYNEGKAFKICARDERGVIVSIIADNYFGYSKKEIKAQISYSANLLGLAEEEHSGGALVFPSYNLGTRFVPDTNLRSRGHNLKHVLELLKGRAGLQSEGYAVDLLHPEIVYLPEDAVISLEDQTARWKSGAGTASLGVRPDKVYIHPTGYRVHMERHPASGAWRLVGSSAEGLLCHKPSTVSGGGKSEIAKSISDAISYSPLIIADYEADMAALRAIIEHGYSKRFKSGLAPAGGDNRSVLSEGRSLGSVIKLLSPSPLYTDEYNAWLKTLPERIKALVFLVKRFYRPDWGGDWASRFTVDAVNGGKGNILKYQGRPVQGSYLRVGRDEKGVRRTFKLRQDFMPAAKVQWEDDITASVVAPAKGLEHLPDWAAALQAESGSLKFCVNVEARFFQRPDDAVVRGYDKQAEKDLSRGDNFISNFEPLSRETAASMAEKIVSLSEYSEPMRSFIEAAAADPDCEWLVASDRPRIVDGAPSKNPRYLQLDPSWSDPLSRYLADLGPRLYRQVPLERTVLHPVGAVLPGRRNNPPDQAAGIRSLAVYGPIHYQDLPELFMDFVCSLTGKSPSTTGAGSEGALTKGPFNSLVPTTDLANALLAFILTGSGGFTTAAGHIGRKYRMEHDISLLVPELWSRLAPEERDPEFLKSNDYLERVEDFSFQGRNIPASRLGWRITPLFAATYLGRIFDTPSAVFADDMLRPELQSMEDFVDGIENIAQAQAKSAAAYLEDGSADAAIPPLRALLYVMATGCFEGKSIHEPSVRALFTKDYVLSSPWYRDRLERYRNREIGHLEASVAYIRSYLAERAEGGSAVSVEARARFKRAEARLEALMDANYLERIKGTIGLDPLFRGKK